MGALSSDSAETRDAAANEAGQFDAEFEMVLGKRQAASLTFLVLVIVAVCSGGSYLIGRAAPLGTPPVQPELHQAVVPDPPPIPPAPAPEAQPAAVALPEEPPLFGSPLKGPIYIQLGAVDKGVATLLAHGARKLGFTAFVSQGTTPAVFRVLVGPFKNGVDFEAAQTKFREIGLDNFSRRYQEQ